MSDDDLRSVVRDDAFKTLLDRFDIQDLKQETAILIRRRDRARFEHAVADHAAKVVSDQLAAGAPPNVKYCCIGGRRTAKRKQQFLDAIDKTPLAVLDETAKDALVNDVFPGQ